MANSNVTYRFYIPEQLRKYLGITLRKKDIFLFKINNELYLSTDTIPIDLKNLTIIKATVGQHQMFVDIPKTILDYTPNTYKLIHAKGKIIKFKK